MKLAPSILAADLADLASAARLCEEGGADLIHVDVMDGHFVPNLSFGNPMVKALARHSDLPLDVHLMVANPDAVIDGYLDAGANWVSVHWEAATHLDRLLSRIRESGARCGVALNPATPIEVLDQVLPILDYVVLMSVNPGFAGQHFIPAVLEKTRRLAAAIEGRGLSTEIELDGGVGLENVAEVVEAGARICVAGSAVFGTEDPAATMRQMQERSGGGQS